MHELAGVRIDYNANDKPAESITLGPFIDDDDTIIRSTGGVTYNEKYVIDVVVFVGSRASIGTSEERADELVTAVVGCLRGDPRIGFDGAWGFIKATAIRTDVLSGEVKGEGAMTRVDIAVECEARITG